MRKNITDTLVDSVLNLITSDIPETVIWQAKSALIDYLGVTLAGAELIREKGNRFLKSTGPGNNGEATIVGFDEKASLPNAAFLNGMCAHAAELDDGERFGMMHPGAPVISALLPLAEVERITGTNLILGIIAGYEVSLRIASSLQPFLKKRGYHATGVCGTIGAAIGSAVAMQLPSTMIKTALSAAATSAAGILKVIRGASELKPYNAGQAALNGLVAALVARAGFQGPEDVFSGEDGILHLYGDGGDVSRLLSETHAPFRFQIENIYKKPYAACRHCHSAIDAVLEIRGESGAIVDSVKKIEVATYDLAINGHDHIDIRSASSAKMSIPYSVAVAFIYGRAGLQEFMADRINDECVLELTRKVQVSADEEFSRLCPKKRVAVVRVVTHDGKCWEERVDLPKGEPENPLSTKDIEQKFISLAVFGGKSEDEAAEILKLSWNIEDSLEQLYDLLGRKKHGRN